MFCLHQVDKNPVQVENVHGILAAAASRFTASHLDHLFQLIQQVPLLCQYTYVLHVSNSSSKHQYQILTLCESNGTLCNTVRLMRIAIHTLCRTG